MVVGIEIEKNEVIQGQWRGQKSTTTQSSFSCGHETIMRFHEV